jgi:molybdopterin-biosynthesis enzyme MoeA-like protein
MTTTPLVELERVQRQLDAEYFGLTLQEEAEWLVRLSRYYVSRAAMHYARSRRTSRIANAALVGGLTGAAVSIVSALMGVK